MVRCPKSSHRRSHSASQLTGTVWRRLGQGLSSTACTKLPAPDSLLAFETSLTARAEARQSRFGRSWDWVASLMVAARTGKPIDRIEVRLKCDNAATRSVAHEADATVKLSQVDVLSSSYATTVCEMLRKVFLLNLLQRSWTCPLICGMYVLAMVQSSYT